MSDTSGGREVTQEESPAADKHIEVIMYTRPSCFAINRAVLAAYNCQEPFQTVLLQAQQSPHLRQVTLLAIPQLLGLLQVLCGLGEQALAGEDHTELVVVLQQHKSWFLVVHVVRRHVLAATCQCTYTGRGQYYISNTSVAQHFSVVQNWFSTVSLTQVLALSSQHDSMSHVNEHLETLRHVYCLSEISWRFANNTLQEPRLARCLVN